jgi:hypothetical protein
MVTVIVNHNKVSGINVGGASALQDYLLSPATQARIRTFRNPKLNIPIFFPAGRDNEESALSLGKPGRARGGGGRSFAINSVSATRTSGSLFGTISRSSD